MIKNKTTAYDPTSAITWFSVFLISMLYLGLMLKFLF